MTTKTNYSKESLKTTHRDTLIAVGIVNGKKRADLIRLSREVLLDVVFNAQKED